MPIPLNSLRAAARRSYTVMRMKTVDEAYQRRKQTAFLCHSHDDQDLAAGLEILLYENGWELYIDWKDNSMPEKPDRRTAQRIQERILSLDWFLFLATPNSTSSRWCPWEIGYADKSKSLERILVIPTSDQTGRWYGNEYLQLYKQLTSATGGLEVFPAGQTTDGVSIRNL